MMRALLPQLVLRVLAAGLATVVIAATYLFWEISQTAYNDTRSTASRVAEAIAARPDFVGLAFGGVSPSPVFNDWQQFPAWTLIAPGVCVEFGMSSQSAHRRCGPYVATDTAAPGWFKWVASEIGVVPGPISVRVHAHYPVATFVTAFADANVILSRAWNSIVEIMQLAVGMAFGGALLTGLLVARLLAPLKCILSGIEGLQQGEFPHRLQRAYVSEFDRLNSALDQTAAALRAAWEQRNDLTRRLFTVQENERRNLARELHDEFGQCLIATRALAASIAQSGESTAEEGERISEITSQMIASLRTELSRLRSQDLDELGLGPALQRLVYGWRVRIPSIDFDLRMDGDLDDVSQELMLSLYRIVQECLTNSIRHGTPKQISIKLDIAEAITLIVEDDGGVHTEGSFGEGHGLLGIRERISALCGQFAFKATENGTRAMVSLPR